MAPRPLERAFPITVADHPRRAAGDLGSGETDGFVGDEPDVLRRSRHRRRAGPALLLCIGALALAAGRPAATQGGPGSIDTGPLWVEPEPGRDLFHGVGGAALAPNPGELFTVTKVKRSGFSDGYTVRDRSGREWGVKLYPEARTEVVASRILWAVGYHQPPIYTLEQWEAVGASGPNPQPVGRFREEAPDFHGLKAGTEWAYDDNPFVGTRALNGLLVLQVMLGNSDLKPLQNVRYSLTGIHEGAREWYVAQDLGHTFGRTGVINAPRDDVAVFERTPFIVGVDGNAVKFDYRGLRGGLFARITVADVQWICRRLAAITDAQWLDAFRAGGYPRPTAERYIRRLEQKIAEGLALGS
jgi:hypothetical protein